MTFLQSFVCVLLDGKQKGNAEAHWVRAFINRRLVARTVDLVV